MTGIGTQNDPFIPNTWDEFVTAIGTSGAYVELPIVPIKTKDEHIMNGKLYFDSQGNRIQSPVESELSDYYENDFKFDMNVVNPLGVLIGFNNCHVNGNGASIVNLYVPSDNTGILIDNGTVYLQNINFLNIYSDNNSNKGVFSCKDNSKNYELTNVQFQGFINRGVMMGVNGNIRKHTSTTFSLTFGRNAKFCPAYLDDSNKYYSFCLFDFYGNPTYLFSTTTFSGGNRFLNCKMTGELFGTYSGTNSLFPSSSNSSTCVIDLDVTNYSDVYFEYSGTNSYIINTDKLSSETTYSGLTGVTTLQLQDTSYLRSIGFPVGD